MVKVTGGGTSVRAVRAHLSYIGRQGGLEIEMDDGTVAAEPHEQRRAADDWHLELTAGQHRRDAHESWKARPTKLVHNIVLSMPAPTSSDAVLKAGRTFAREKFALQHRYALVLHTDQKHPHVHLVVKAENEQGRRLNIDKAMLREWRQDFAEILRDQGIEANATSRAARGRNKRRTSAVFNRMRLHGWSYRLMDELQSVKEEVLPKQAVPMQKGRERLVETRKQLVQGWRRVADQLDAQGESTMAAQVRQYVRGLPRVLTDRERLGVEVLAMDQKRKAAAAAKETESREVEPRQIKQQRAREFERTQ